MDPITNSGIVKVEFVCESCKEGKHGCPGHWTGLGLEIQCSCNCATKVIRIGNENDSHGGIQSGIDEVPGAVSKWSGGCKSQ